MGYATDDISEWADETYEQTVWIPAKKLIVLHALTQCHLLHDKYSVKNPTDIAIKLKDKNDPDVWTVVFKPTLLIPGNQETVFIQRIILVFHDTAKA